jgi:hypothetical protein
MGLCVMEITYRVTGKRLRIAPEKLLRFGARFLGAFCYRFDRTTKVAILYWVSGRAELGAGVPGESAVEVVAGPRERVTPVLSYPHISRAGMAFEPFHPGGAAA